MLEVAVPGADLLVDSQLAVLHRSRLTAGQPRRTSTAPNDGRAILCIMLHIVLLHAPEPRAMDAAG